MRTAAILAAIALAACSPSAPGEADSAGSDAASGAGLFPSLFQTAYRLEATATNDDGESQPVVMVRDGQKLRMEMTSEQGPVVVVMNHDTGENFIVYTMGGRQMAMRQSHQAMFTTPDELWSGDMSASATRIGTCSGAGESGDLWERADESGDVHQGCVTSDGVILAASENGQTTWQATSVQRGPQDPAQFALPAGTQVMDVGAVAADAMKKAQEQMGQ